MKTSAIIIPVHNRKAVSLACLGRLDGDRVGDWAEIVVVDDGSTDGTAAAIRAAFPGVTILPGDGRLWWAGAIVLGMKHALDRGAQMVFWLNDDCLPPAGGLAALRDFIGREGCVAWIEARAPGGWTFGAQRRTTWGMRRCTPAEESAGRAETFNGNCVGLPRAWIERVGLPDNRVFPHGAADFDYGLRLHAAGARLRALPGVVAESGDPAPHAAESWLASRRPMREIWRDFSSPKSYLYFPAWRHFAVRHWGPVWGPVVFAAPYVRWGGIALVRPIRRWFSSPSGGAKDRG